MPSRPDVPLVLLVLGSVLNVLISLGNPSGYLQSTANLAFVGSIVAIFLFAVYWGLVVRRGMAVRLYRNQALGMSLVSFGLLSLFALGFYSPILTSTVSYGIEGDLYALLVFYWVDASMRASQDVDPLSRDSLRWSKLRYVIWALNFAGLAVLLGVLALTGNYGFFDNPTPGLTSSIIFILAILMPFFVTIVAGIVALPIGALRSRDHSFRRQLQWFALALLVLFVWALFATYFANYSTVLFYEAFLVIGYCFYRSAHALVPLSRISSD